MYCVKCGVELADSQRCVPCAAPVCSTRIFPTPLPTRPIPG